MARRGGRQVIPRPTLWRPGGPPPWAELPPEDRHLDVARITERLSGLGEPHGLTIPGAREAAVLVPLLDVGGSTHLVFVKRPDTMPTHQGQIAFPGGGRNALDVTLRDTALREAREEVGLDPEAVHLVAELDRLGTVASPFVIAPFVGAVEGVPALHADPREVVALIDVTVDELLDPEIYREELWVIGETELPVHFFELDGETVWGATARILVNLLTVAIGASPGG